MSRFSRWESCHDPTAVRWIGGALALCGTTVALAASNDPFDISTQIGSNPKLPESNQYLLPPMHLAKVVGWNDGEKPTVAPGLKIEALATGLRHPRSLYVLPNGDILVVESKSPALDPIKRPKDLIMDWVEKLVRSGGSGGG